MSNVPLMMRMLVPTASSNLGGAEATSSEEEHAGDDDDDELVDRLRAVANRHDVDAAPPGTSLLRVVPPKWNAESRTFHDTFWAGAWYATPRVLLGEALEQQGKYSDAIVWVQADLQVPCSAPRFSSSAHRSLALLMANSTRTTEVCSLERVQRGS